MRVLIDSTDGEKTWTTVGVSADLIEASWKALVDSFEYKLIMDIERKFNIFITRYPARKGNTMGMTMTQNFSRTCRARIGKGRRLNRGKLRFSFGKRCDDSSCN